MKVIIVGGVAGGASAAARLRRLDESAEIVMLEKGPYISFANCGLPYYVGDAINDRNKLLLQTPEAFNSRFDVDVRVLSEVLSIDRSNNSVRIKNHNDGSEYIESYDKLILSPGSTPLKPPIKGIDTEGIFTLWTVPDVDKITSYIDEKNPRKAIVCGGGFIGLEMAENLHEKGIEVSIVELAEQVMAPLDYEMAQIVHEHIDSKKVDLYLENGVDHFKKSEDGIIVHLSDGTELEGGIVLMSLGVRPQTSIAKEAGLDLNKRGGIVVSPNLQTSDPNIYAVGDAIEVKDFISGDYTMIPLAGPANKQGRMVAENILGAGKEYKGTQGTSIAKVFDLHAGTTGWNEKQLIRNNKVQDIDFKVLNIHPGSHAGYYPGAFPVHLKLIYNPNDRKVLGAQAVGYDGIDKRIDVIATVIRLNGTIDDLTELELAYAPPFGSAKDPVNFAGFVAENNENGMSKLFSWNQIEKLKSEGWILLDVRTAIENKNGAIPGSIHIPVDELRSRLSDLDNNNKYLIYCAVGIRGHIASRIMLQNGFQVRNLTGGFTTYKQAYWKKKSRKSIPLIGKGKKEIVCQSKVVGENYILDATGLSCPGPIQSTFQKMEELSSGDILEVQVTDSGFASDIGPWCIRTGNTLIQLDKKKHAFIAKIQKGTSCGDSLPEKGIGSDKTLVCFSGDLDKALASMIIAQGAAAMGRKVTIFFTFWGLNIIRKSKKIKGLKKTFIEKMFEKMMPRGPEKLKLSNMQMGGFGSSLIKGIMKKHNISQLEDAIQKVQDSGATLLACSTSMELMGIKKEELLDGVKVAGVAAYIDAAENGTQNLFI